jgi:hypothetical protein
VQLARARVARTKIDARAIHMAPHFTGASCGLSIRLA